MKNKYVFTLILLLFAPFLNAQVAKMDWLSKVGARPKPTTAKIYTANDYGAQPDGITLSSHAIQQAIDLCSKHGGGVVVLKPGIYVCGAVFIKDNVHLRIDKGVIINGSQNFNDYPEIDTRIAGIEMKWPAALFNIIHAKNAALTGEGVVNARGKFCWDKYWTMRKEYDQKGLRWIVDYDAKRVRTVLVQNASDIQLKGLTFQNAGFWTVQLLYADHITVDGLTIQNNLDGNGPSTDGIDIDSSSWVLIQHCDIDCNDDNFCLKAGRDWDGLRVNRPTEYVLIRNCLARKGGGLVTLGSETSGGIRHVLAKDLVAHHTDNGLRIKSATTRGGTIEDIHFTKCTMDSVKYVFNYTLNWNPAYSYAELPKGYVYDSLPAHWKSMLQKVTPIEKGIPHAKDIFVSNLQATHVQNIFSVVGLETSLLTHFNYKDCKISAESIGPIEYTKDWNFTHVQFDISKPKPIVKPVSKEVEERMKN